MVAGLGTITPASGFVGPGGALIIGLLAGGICFSATMYLKRVLKIDDSLDVFPVHGVGGMLGTLMAGVFSATSLGVFSGYGFADGIDSMGGQLWVQFVGVVSVPSSSPPFSPGSSSRWWPWSPTACAWTPTRSRRAWTSCSTRNGATTSEPAFPAGPRNPASWRGFSWRGRRPVPGPNPSRRGRRCLLDTETGSPCPFPSRRRKNAVFRRLRFASLLPVRG